MAKKKPEYDYIPDDIAPNIPKLYSTEKQEDPIVWIKLFTPDSSWTWLLTEYDPIDEIAFGLVDGFEREFGYFSLQEIKELRGRLGLPVERDLHWTPKPISQCE